MSALLTNFRFGHLLAYADLTATVCPVAQCGCWFLDEEESGVKEIKNLAQSNPVKLNSWDLKLGLFSLNRQPQDQ